MKAPLPVIQEIALPDGRTVTIESGRMARQADGSITPEETRRLERMSEWSKRLEAVPPGAGPGLLHRYGTDPNEGAFGICSFWEVEYFALGGGTLSDATGVVNVTGP